MLDGLKIICGLPMGYRFFQAYTCSASPGLMQRVTWFDATEFIQTIQFCYLSGSTWLSHHSNNQYKNRRKMQSQGSALTISSILLSVNTGSPTWPNEYEHFGDDQKGEYDVSCHTLHQFDAISFSPSTETIMAIA
jgi:hypothetical protein